MSMWMEFTCDITGVESLKMIVIVVNVDGYCDVLRGY